MAAVASMVVTAALNRRAQSDAALPRMLSLGSRLGWIRRRAAAMVLLVSAVAFGLILFQPGREWLLQNYFSRKLAGDQGRLDVLACYTALPFSDGSRWALGMGYEEAWRSFCNEDVGITVTHAHNFVAQLMGETGLISTLAVLVALAAMWLPLLRRAWIGGSTSESFCSADPQRQTIQTQFIAVFLFIIVFALFEITFLKVTVLECLIGYLLSMSFCGKAQQSDSEQLQPSTSHAAP